jgi:hypothetical protein
MHVAVKKIYASRELENSKKEGAMQKLMEADKSELIGETKAFCEGCATTAAEKKVIWDGLLSTKYDDASLLVHESYCAGLR